MPCTQCTEYRVQSADIQLVLLAAGTLKSSVSIHIPVSTSVLLRAVFINTPPTELLPAVAVVVTNQHSKYQA
jgi:hypothetical protein